MAAIPNVAEDLSHARERRAAVDRVLQAADTFVDALLHTGEAGVETKTAGDTLSRAWFAFETARAAVNSKRAAYALVDAVVAWRMVRA